MTTCDTWSRRHVDAEITRGRAWEAYRVLLCPETGAGTDFPVGKLGSVPQVPPLTFSPGEGHCGAEDGPHAAPREAELA